MDIKNILYGIVFVLLSMFGVVGYSMVPKQGYDVFYGDQNKQQQQFASRFQKPFPGIEQFEQVISQENVPYEKKQEALAQFCDGLSPSQMDALLETVQTAAQAGNSDSEKIYINEYQEALIDGLQKLYRDNDDSETKESLINLYMELYFQVKSNDNIAMEMSKVDRDLKARAKALDKELNRKSRANTDPVSSQLGAVVEAAKIRIELDETGISKIESIIEQQKDINAQIKRDERVGLFLDSLQQSAFSFSTQEVGLLVGYGLASLAPNLEEEKEKEKLKKKIEVNKNKEKELLLANQALMYGAEKAPRSREVIMAELHEKLKGHK